MMPMQRVGLPPILIVFLSVTIGVADFDVFDPARTTELHIEFDYELTEAQQAKFDELIPQHMQDFNYDNTNSLLILGSVALFMLLYFLRMTVWNSLIWHASVYSKPMR